MKKILGEWELLADKSEYEVGTPPKSALYTFKTSDDKTLDIQIKWTDLQDKAFELNYSITPDGKKYPYENNPAVDEVSSEFESDNILTSSSFKNNSLITFAKREISSDGIMKVTQTNVKPDGTKFSNIQYYKKVV